MWYSNTWDLRLPLSSPGTDHLFLRNTAEVNPFEVGTPKLGSHGKKGDVKQH